MITETFRTADAKLTVFLNGPNWDGIPAATFGNFSCKSSEAGAEILQKGMEKVRSAGIDRIIGPMSGDTWHSYRFVSDSDGSDPFMMEPTNKPHEPDVFRAAGFAEISRYFSARVALQAATASAPPETDGYVLEAWDGSDPEALFRQVFALSTRAFSNNAFYKPISEADFMAMYLPIVPMLKRELILFARRHDGTLAGFLFGIPNYAEGPNPTSAILKTYASLEPGAGRHLAHKFHKTAFGMGFENAIHALIHDDNTSADRSAAEGATIFRRYTLLGQKLNG
ncbi:hypothetical protein SAMN05444358_103281 [Ruegeria halocynthiae]|uniref:N-acetyltransferase domain-containing protein n=1 Tax=Ruegeria halocynthiae TaxID=985054 RepID=A0A1H2ZLK9_9RHOB|nr:hypothetical protein [Ruegeria halocynthiae]SDX18226.1 hypothetical protein SAMN05444358_103281 [Ruegeria halocynthiae]